MVTVDAYAGKPTVRAETLEALEGSPAQPSARSHQQTSVTDPDGAVYLYTRGYWITRYLNDTQPALLRGLLVNRMPHDTLEEQIAAALDMDRGEFWQRIDPTVVSHFKQRAAGK